MDHDHGSHAQGHSMPPQQVPNTTMTTLQDDGILTDQMLHLPLLHGGVREILLFPFFATSDDASFALACLILVVVACALELLRLPLSYMDEAYLSEAGSTGAAFACRCKHTAATQTLISSGDVKNYNTLTSEKEQQQQQQKQQQQEEQHMGSLQRWARLAGVGIMQTLVYLVATLLMLVAMTMNIYIILALSAGSGVGKMVTLWLRRRYRERSWSGSKHHCYQRFVASSTSTSDSCVGSSASLSPQGE